jgi:diguanylate cyclase (GGDEF)-like protein
VRDLIQKINDERFRDSLTHLLNRRGFFAAAKHFLDKGDNQRYFVMTCDIDHFKSINDNWGHLSGDKVLQTVSQTIVRSVRDNDLVARFGGEEFVIFLRGADMTDARAVAERIRTEIAAIRFTEIPTRVTASFGIVEFNSNHDLVQTIDHADTLLYSAKQNGRNQICWH